MTKTLLLDADILMYSIGGLKNQYGEPEVWPIIVSMFDTMIENMFEATGCSNVEVYLTSDDKSNFRIQKATIKPYKGHRKSEKPYHYQTLRNFLIASRGAIQVHGMEADDQLSIRLIELGDNGVLASKDKDLDIAYGWHYNWEKKKKYKIDKITGLRNFYKQLLTGDGTDNIPGLFGIGKDNKILKKIDLFDNELDMYKFVKHEYERRFGSYWKLFLYENAHLLWILQTTDIEEILKRFEQLEKDCVNINIGTT